MVSMSAPTKRSREARTRGPDLDQPVNRKPTKVSRMRGSNAVELTVVPKRKRVRGTDLNEFPDERLNAISQLCWAGATDYEIAATMGISMMTLQRWANANPQLREALTTGKDVFDNRIARMLAVRALGYSYESEKVAINADGMVTRAPIVEHIPPDVTAMIFWLKNRDPEKWRDAKNIAVEGEINVNTNQPTDRQVAMALINMLREATTDAMLEDSSGSQMLTIDNLPAAEPTPADATLGFRRKPKERT